jgi:hypothetical protein
MKEPPGWLPPIISVNGEWNEVLARLYEIFERDFKETQRTLNGKLVWWVNAFWQAAVMKKASGILYQRSNGKQEKGFLIPDERNVFHGVAQPSAMQMTIVLRFGILRRPLDAYVHMFGSRIGIM